MSVHSINKTITYTTIVWVALIMIVGQVIVDRVISGWLLEQYDATLDSKARALVTLAKFDGTEVELDFADEFMTEFEALDNPEYFELFLANGDLVERSNSFAETAKSQFTRQFDEVVITDLRLPDGRVGRRVSIKFIPQIEDKVLRLDIPLEQRPEAILRLSRERETLDQFMQRLHLLIIGICLAVLAAVMLSVSRATKSGLLPLFQIRQEISQVSPSSIDRRITSQGLPIELEPIATQFNLVLAEIEKAFIREREFSADVAHELRTPVSEIRALTEVGLRWPDEEDIRSYFGDIHESAIQLDRLIENLLQLCRSEEGETKFEIGNISLYELLMKILAGLEAEISKRDISVELPGLHLPVVKTDAQLLELILHNLIHNAVTHSPPGTTCEISVSVDAGHCAMEFENSMLDPLTDADLNLIFERFWRKDSARQSGQHAGIGLALVRSYAQIMGLEVEASLSDSGHFRIRVSNISIV